MESVHMYFLSTNWKCHPHIQSHMKGRGSEGHTCIAGRREEFPGSGFAQDCSMGPLQLQAAAVEAICGRRVVETPDAETAAEAGQ